MTPIPPKPSEAEFDFAPFGYHRSGASSSAMGGRTINIGRFLMSIWKPLAYGGMLGLIIGMLVYSMMGPVYTASTQVLVSKKASVPTGDGEANRYGDRADHLKLLRTDAIIERAFKDHGLQDVPELASGYDPYKSVSEDLSTSRASGQESSFDNILEIGYSHPDKEIAKKVVQAMVEAYRDYLTETRAEGSQQVYSLLLKQQQELEDEVRNAEADYQKFRHDAPVFLKASPVVTVNGMPAPAQNRFEAEVTELEKAQRDNMRRRAGIQAKLATLERMISEAKSREVLEFWVLHSLSTGTATNSGSGGAGAGGGAAALTGPPAKAALDGQLLTARLLEQRLLHTLGPDHTSVRNVRRQIDTILDFYHRQGLTPPAIDRGEQPISANTAATGMDMVNVYEQMLKEQLQELDSDDEKLALLHTDAQQRAKNAEMFEVEDGRRKDDIARLKKQSELVFAQLADYDVIQEQEGYRLKQISQVRLERSLKRVAKIVGAFMMLGMALVFCLSYFREWSDTRLKSLDEVRDLTGQQIMGAVPTFTTTSDLERLAARGPIHPTLCYYHRPGSREAEAFRSIRTTLFFSMRSGEQVVQVSSPEPGDGKSTSAANLAIAVAQSGKRVLIIDADLRRPTQHGLFGLPQENGLTDVLLRELSWQNAIRPTLIEGLSVMTAGLCPENPAELLSTQVLHHVLEEARRNFDIVILDSPPVLAVSDPCIISPHADGMLLVVRMLKNKEATLRRTQEMLSAHGVRTMGVIVNDLNSHQADEEGLGYESYSKYYTPANPLDAGLPLRSGRQEPTAVTPG
ncbi:MAG: polysaccharide biosynthesis tyrosine autokinase [Planctomycetaceae bacterium]|nr:polysaccharide biosynthesis tyrosine autokinase [Planctomycetaceae bacterium]